MSTNKLSTRWRLLVLAAWFPVITVGLLFGLVGRTYAHGSGFPFGADGAGALWASAGAGSNEGCTAGCCSVGAIAAGAGAGSAGTGAAGAAGGSDSGAAGIGAGWVIGGGAGTTGGATSAAPAAGSGWGADGSYVSDITRTVVGRR